MDAGLMAAAGFKISLLALLCAACTSIAVDARTFAGTRWHVTAINGRATPATGDYHVEFGNGTIAGRFGCNGFGGRYAVSGELMRATEIRSTMMACSDPAASFEGEGFAIVRQPMRMMWERGCRLTLDDAKGAIALEQIP
jgi:heat shock protein HslJ